MEPRVWHRSYDPDVPPSLVYERLTLPQLLERAATRHGDAPAILFHNCRMTYRELKDAVDRLANALAALGVRPGTRVAIQLPNIPQVVIAYYATLRLGAHAVLTNPLYVPREIAYQWQDADCRVAVVTDFIFEAKIRGIRERLPVEHYVVASIPEYLRIPLRWLARLKLKRAKPPAIARVARGPGVHVFRELMDRTAPHPPPVAIGLDDVATLQYTGGTTGPSKGAMLTHRNLSCNVQQMRAWFPSLVDGKEVVLTALPIFHSFGMTVCMNLAVGIAGAMALVPNPRDIPAVMHSITKHRATLFPAVPAMYAAIINHPHVQSFDLSSVKRCVSGSAPLPVETLRRFEELTGAIVSEGFGLSETSPVTHSNPLVGRRKPGSIGVPLPDTDAKVVDLETGLKTVPTGETGELALAGPQVMAGYWNKPDETAAMIRDGWLYTGDLARVDEDGYCFIVGRKKDMILCGGFNVYPDEIDRILAGHPAVAEAATIGIPDERRGETVKSFIVVKSGQRATADELIAYCRENLAPFKVPRTIEFRSELPKSTVLKVLRRELRDQELAKRSTGALAGFALVAVSLALGQAPPSTDIYLADLRGAGDHVQVGTPVNATHRTGYDNQPFFTPDGRAFLFTSVIDGQADIWRYDIAANRSVQLTKTTPESEYSATPLPDGSGFSVVRVEADSTQRLWRFDWDGSHPALVLVGVKPVGYHAWGDDHTLALFVLGQPATLQIADLRTGHATPVASDIGRGVQRIPGRAAISFVQKGADSVWTVTELDVATGQIRALVRTLPGVDQYAWTPNGVLLMAKGTKLYEWRAGGAEFREVSDFATQGLTNLTRLAVSPRGDRLALVAADRTP
ncbi:MAG TPA: AMP-binding protein [Gemmatimonadales bacterium]|jgi:long-chain acyl-CoA synthetase|nr:AMP-binding protein [Gemmatimonadales bacterium]